MTVSTDFARDLTAMREHLHQIPEVGLHLPQTQEFMFTQLEALGDIELSTGDSVTSITGVIRGGKATRDANGVADKIVLLRGDMDALPVAESTGLDFASTNGNMHACGHDLHTTMLFGAASQLRDRRDDLEGDVVLMFQPGEEGCDGARYMVDEGVLEAAGRTADAAFALHVMSANTPLGEFRSREGLLMASSNRLHVTVRGAGGHGSTPHLAKDPVVVAAEMVVSLQTLVTRQLNLFDSAVISVGVLRAGEAINVIPETAYFEATVRAFSDSTLEQLRVALPRLLRGIAAAHNVEVDVDFIEQYPPTITNPDQTQFAGQVISDLLDPKRYENLRDPFNGSEDFSRVLNRVPGSMVILGACPPGRDHATAAFNHSPYADFDSTVLSDGTSVYTELAVRRLASLKAPSPTPCESSVAPAAWKAKHVHYH
ncbi:amidohydrolase [Micrococcales bacterium 31B]|nr:amidohydrolase [Micrococcales bacterium 31B]